jgi:phage baseplate assembly protein W
MISIAVPTTTEADLRQALCDILAETTLAAAKVADAIAMDVAAGASASVKCHEARTLLTAICWAAVTRLEEAALQSTTNDLAFFTCPPTCH